MRLHSFQFPLSREHARQTLKPRYVVMALLLWAGGDILSLLLELVDQFTVTI